MKEKILKILKYVLFLSIGLGLVYYQTKDMNLKEELTKAKNMNWLFFGFSTIFGLVAHYSRAVRWRYLIQPLGYNPRIINVFFSVMFMYLSNIMVPRSGEVARCGSLYKYEKIPVPKLLGTVVVERLSDLLMLLILTVVLFFWEYDVLRTAYLESALPDFLAKLVDNTLLVVGLVVFALGVLGVIIWKRKALAKNKIVAKIFNFLEESKNGLVQMTKLKKKWLFLAHTLLIWGMYVAMFYICFFAFEPTEHLGINVGFACFVAGSFGMVAPTNGGMGAWHFMVAIGLTSYSVSQADANTFVNVAFVVLTMISVIFGAICTALLPYVNRNKVS